MPIRHTRLPEDKTRINVENPEEFRWWCGRLGCSDLKLREAVRKVGRTTNKVEQYLRHRRVLPR